MGKFAVKETANGGVKFNLKAGNGEIIATSQVYKSMPSCKKGIASVIVDVIGACIVIAVARKIK